MGSRNLFIRRIFFLNLPLLRQAAERWEKSPFGTIFPNDRSASPTVGKPSLHSHDVLPTVAFDAFRKGVKTPFGTTTKPSGRYRQFII
ncbi:hypothetical protein [Flavobacterium macacae]|uniref:Uncharacterized protein n=1 Tax=Flavobacterium macacae TaxID=2488993 RepID=A0A3P3VYW1_9FLAO|nr:hypothetical protein [Flavobacterium macacae]RRJ87674.1 hypothetical protein EG849_15265 [Flavobacterium macacae]